MLVEFAIEHEKHLCRALVALRGAATPWVTPSEVPMTPSVCTGLRLRGWIHSAGGGGRRWQLTESGQGMAALIASLLEV